MTDKELMKEMQNFQDEDASIKRVSTYEFDEDGYSNEFPMECGYTDKDDAKHDTFRFREMNGKDEEAINNPSIKSNGGKVINTLLSRCVVSIGSINKKDITLKEWEDIIKSLCTGDQDIMTMCIREASLGHAIEVNHKCPNEDCGAKLNTFIQTNEIEVIYFKGIEVIPFELKRGFKTRKGDLLKSGTLRLPNGYDREVLTPLAKKNAAKASTLMLTRTVKFDGFDLPLTDDIMSSFTTGDRKILNDLLKENTFGLKFDELETTCSTCGETIHIGLNQINFI